MAITDILQLIASLQIHYKIWNYWSMHGWYNSVSTVQGTL